MKVYAQKNHSKLQRSSVESLQSPFATLLQPHIDYLFQLAVYCCGDRAQAEELLRNFLQEIKSYSQYLNKVVELRQWLLCEFYGVFVEQYNTKAQPNTALYFSDSNPQSEYSTTSLSERLQALITTLPVKQRAMLVLHDIEGLSLSQIKQIVHSPPELLKNRLRIARETIRTALIDTKAFPEFEKTHESEVDGSCANFMLTWSTVNEEGVKHSARKEHDRHLRFCSECQWYDGQMRLIVKHLGMLKKPEPLSSVSKENLFIEVQQSNVFQDTFSHKSMYIAAVAASLIFTATLFWSGYNKISYSNEVPIVVMTVNKSQQLELAFDSRRTIDNVSFTVELPDGITLVGYPAQREVSWTGSLEAGRNKLILPLMAGELDFAEEYLIAKIRYEDTETTLKVLLINGYS